MKNYHEGTITYKCYTHVTLTCFDKDRLMNEEEQEHSYIGED